MQVVLIKDGFPYVTKRQPVITEIHNMKLQNEGRVRGGLEQKIISFVWACPPLIATFGTRYIIFVFICLNLLIQF